MLQGGHCIDLKCIRLVLCWFVCMTSGIICQFLKTFPTPSAGAAEGINLLGLEHRQHAHEPVTFLASVPMLHPNLW